MDPRDEPVVGPAQEIRPGPEMESPALRDKIRALLHGQPFAVLCTQGGGQPYGSVVAYAFGDDLRAVTFCTPVNTRKYRLLSECEHAALVVDSRCQHLDNMMQVEAITATGRAVQLESGLEYDRWAATLTDRHPQLQAFVAAPSSALFRLDILRYLHVSRFQEVHQWIPNHDPPKS